MRSMVVNPLSQNCLVSRIASGFPALWPALGRLLAALFSAVLSNAAVNGKPRYRRIGE